MTQPGHAPKGPREAEFNKRMEFLEQWCERNVPSEFYADKAIVLGVASQAGHEGKLSPEYVRERLKAWR